MKDKKDVKTKVIPVRVTMSDYEVIKKISDMNGVTISDTLRRWIGDGISSCDSRWKTLISVWMNDIQKN